LHLGQTAAGRRKDLNLCDEQQSNSHGIIPSIEATTG
jgi:hypothetical protein